MSNKKIDNKEFSKIKKFVLQRTLSTVKKKPTKWEKTFANHISDKALIIIQNV